MDDIERVVLGLIAEAGPRLRDAWHAAKNVEHKGAVDLVTDTDRDIEALVVSRLARAFPDHLIIGEEEWSGKALVPPPPDRYTWYVDPLDGTTNFAHGYPLFALSLALARGGEICFGSVHDPLREETFTAHAGHGARLNGRVIHVSTVADLDRALLATGFPYDRRARAEFYIGFFQDFMKRAQGLRRAGSAAIDLCWVACGRLEGFWEWKLRPWDTAAGALIVREAGGMVSDFRGGPFDLHGEQTLASNGLVHQEMVGVLRARLEQH